MIAKMLKYTFLVYHQQYEQFLEKLRNVGVLHINELKEGVAENDLLREKLQLLGRLDKLIAETKALLPENAALEPSGDYDEKVLLEALSELKSARQQAEQKQTALLREAHRIEPWGTFDAERFEQLKKAGLCLQFFQCADKKFNPQWAEQYNALEVSRDGKTVRFITVNHAEVSIEDADSVDLGNSDAEVLQQQAAELKKETEKLGQTITEWAITNYNNLLDFRSRVKESADWDKALISTLSVADEKVKLLVGFCPDDKVAELNQMLNNEGVYYETADPTEEDLAPVKLNNNRFAKLFEVFTGMYGWPVYGEFDPTPILAPFYLLFFSMCMGDAGYGILLIAFGLLVHYKKINIAMFEGLGPIIATLGVGTLVVGFFLGTAFGVDLSTIFPSIDYLFLNGKIITDGGIQYVSKAAYKAQEMKGGYDVAMVLAVLIGVFHICLAMVIKALCYTKRFGFRNQLSTWGWTLLIVGGISALIICMALSLPMEVTKWVLIGIAGVSALGIYIFNTPGRNPLLNIGAGLWDTYNMATGILGDTLSYIRLYALGLAGGKLGGAFNNLGLMVLGDATWQWLPFIIILLIGHLLNLAMSALGAFVHPLRLTFVEYFKNSGYEGKGKLYSPFAKK
ncbi:MAG: ATPase V [Paludibacteraceae bacterium]|nr:ATPase V [Paludibacteraceae bacterium]